MMARYQPENEEETRSEDEEGVECGGIIFADYSILSIADVGYCMKCWSGYDNVCIVCGCTHL
jgi:hypothetical protein